MTVFRILKKRRHSGFTLIEGWGYDDNMRRFCMKRHGAAVNGVFLDGHTSIVKLVDLWKLRWHKGYEPAPIKLP
jgi:prepilin-type processing-associated H-X9-DG protein